MAVMFFEPRLDDLREFRNSDAKTTISGGVRVFIALPAISSNFITPTIPMIWKRWFNYHCWRGLPCFTHSSRCWGPPSIPFCFQIGNRPRELSLRRFVENTSKRLFGLQKHMERLPDLSPTP